MSELLLQSIVEKLDGLEIAMLKKEDRNKEDAAGYLLLKETKAIQAEITKLVSGTSETNEKLQKLSVTLSLLNLNSDVSNHAKVTHTHHLHKGLWVAVGFSILATFFLYGWIKSSAAKEQYKANDILYRYLKVNGRSDSLKGLYHLDSLYNANPDAITKLVNQQEQNLAEQVKLIKESGEKKKEGNELKCSMDKVK